MEAEISDDSVKKKVLIMVSRFGHCLNDLLYRWRIGALPIDIVGVISNHHEYQKVVVNHDIPFHMIRVTADTKAKAEAQQMEIIEQTGAELVVLARYMQVLSDNFLNKVGCPVINIHHSFLPAFAGGKPYHQAHLRGVKLIGATAHYATADLDEGPIIHQDVTRINHRNAISDLIRKGRDLEKSVFAQAIRLHLDNRILVYNNRTVVFD